MKDSKPILFSGEMVRALLDGRKTQTRRVVKPQPTNLSGPNFDGLWSDTIDPVTRYFACPHGQPGTILYVKEATWMFCERRPNGLTKKGRPKWHYVPLRSAPVYYIADWPKKPNQKIDHPETGNQWGWKYKSARFMPRWASRITLEIVSIKVERVQEISEADILAEGVTVDRVAKFCNYPWSDMPTLHHAWRVLWEHINGPDSWKANPWCWCLTFKRLTP